MTRREMARRITGLEKTLTETRAVLLEHMQLEHMQQDGQPAGFHWPAWCPCGDGYHTAADPALAAAQRRAELMGSYGHQQEVQKRIHDTKGNE